MKAFGDAVYFIALLSTRDRWHTRVQFQAHRSRLSIRKPFVTRMLQLLAARTGLEPVHRP